MTYQDYTLYLYLEYRASGEWEELKEFYNIQNEHYFVNLLADGKEVYNQLF
jgi:hypothetical protein